MDDSKEKGLLEVTKINVHMNSETVATHKDLHRIKTNKAPTLRRRCGQRFLFLTKKLSVTGISKYENSVHRKYIF